MATAAWRTARTPTTTAPVALDWQASSSLFLARGPPSPSLVALQQLMSNLGENLLLKLRLVSSLCTQLIKVGATHAAAQRETHATLKEDKDEREREGERKGNAMDGGQRT